MEKIDTIYRLLASKKFALYLFFGLAALLVPKTLISQPVPYIDWTMRAVLGLLLVNLSLCTIHRFKILRKATLLIHIGSIVTITGSLISGLGYVATINIHEGAATNTVFRWDIEQDVPLGFALKVKEIRREFYPIFIQVGVLNNSRKDSLHTLKTGESFKWGEFTILAESLDLDSRTLLLKVYGKNGLFVGSYDTSGENSLPAGFPLTFQLVAFKDPILKNVGVVLTLSEGNQTLAEGFSEVNAPLKWNGLKFHVTNVDVDQYGLPYAGLQIVRDPGIYIVYAGFVIICLGCLLHLQKSFGRKSAL